MAWNRVISTIFTASCGCYVVISLTGCSKNLAGGDPGKIVIGPNSVSATIGSTLQFTASGQGISDSNVSWSVSGLGCDVSECGSISSGGLYTAPLTIPRSPVVSVTASTREGSNTASSSTSITIVPPQAAGYSLAWEDTFSTLSVCQTISSDCNWYNPGLWWESAAGGISDTSGTYVTLEWAAGQANNTNISTASPNGAYSRSWNSGYIEISMAFQPVTGSSPAIWLLPAREIGANTSTDGVLYGELDLFEWQSQTPNTGYGTVHVWMNGADIANNNASDGWTAPANTDFSQFNTYGLLWTPTKISWYFNDIPVETVDTISSPYSSVFNGSESYFLILSEQASCNWKYPCPGQVSPLNMQVQWVHVYSPPSS